MLNTFIKALFIKKNCYKQHDIHRIMMSFLLELPGLFEIDENYSVFILNEIKKPVNYSD